MNIKDFFKQPESVIVVKSSSGGGAGSILKVEFNTNCYFFIYCTWRIEQNEHVIATSSDNIDAVSGRIAQSAKLLEGKRVLSIQTTKQYDLAINFEDNFCLNIFCDVSYSSTDNGGTYNLNWEFCTPDENKVISVDNSFKKIENRYWE
jgi:hypothetical protein